jgi:hypothetical protein
VNVAPLLVTPPTVTTTFPVAAPAGAGTTMLVADQDVGVAVVPLNLTVLVPFVDPKFAPAIVTDVPTGPLAGVRLVTVGAFAATVNIIALLAAPPTVTTTFPLVAPDGTAAVMLEEDQFVGDAAVPPKVTALVPRVDPKFAPAMVTIVPAAPLDGDRLTIVGVVPETVAETSAEYGLIAPLVLYARTAK